MNLAYFYPTIFWNTANLIVDSGAEYEYDEDEDEDDYVEVEGSTSDYGKIASAIGRIQDVGVKVYPPNINKSKLTYTPDAENNTISYGLTGITGVGSAVVEEIINKRPFTSIEDFLSRVKVNKTQMVNLIKSGAFNEFGERYDLMTDYLDSISGAKKKLNLQNANMLIQNGLIPDEMSESRGMFNLNKYMRKFKDKETDMITLDETVYEVYKERYDVDDLEFIDNKPMINASLWKSKYYDPQMNYLRQYIKDNHDELLKKLNRNLAQEMWDKYDSGSLASWSMDSVSFYQDEHELADKDFSDWNTENFFDLPIEPEIGKSFISKRGNQVNLMRLTHIVGTVVDKEKNKSTITLLTTDGVVKVKAYGVFNAYDKRVSRVMPDGRKKVVENSWFSRGNILIVQGFRRGGMFIAKKYGRNPEEHHFYKVVGFDEDSKPIIQGERMQG